MCQYEEGRVSDCFVIGGMHHSRKDNAHVCEYGGGVNLK